MPEITFWFILNDKKNVRYEIDMAICIRISLLMCEALPPILTGRVALCCGGLETWPVGELADIQRVGKGRREALAKPTADKH